jgi:hypothetical protein
VKNLAGLAGFKPTITESKSVALPLGYSPTKSPLKGISIIDNGFIVDLNFVVLAELVVELVVIVAAALELPRYLFGFELVAIVAVLAQAVAVLVAIVVDLHFLEQLEQPVVLVEQLELLVALVVGVVS